MSLLLIGAGHVFRIEEPIRRLIAAERPDIVALELDAGRYEGLLRREAGTLDPTQALADAPKMYRRLAKFQEEVAASFGTQVGQEMVAAARAAQSVGSRLELIDRSAQSSVERLWAEMGWRERVRLFLASLGARLPWRRGASVESEVARYQEDPVGYLEEVGRQYPTIKRVLLDERNEHMATQLRSMVVARHRVVAVVGDGHVPGLMTILADLSPRVIRLSELRRHTAGGIQWTRSTDGAAVGFSFDGQSLEDAFQRA